MDQQARQAFTPRPIITFSSAKKLNSYLGKTKLYTLERNIDSCKCNGKRDEVFGNVTEISTFTSILNQNTYKINHEFN